VAVVARLTGVNVLVVLVAFVTSPILARALGPAGRGELAAIFAVLTVAPWIAELGVTAYLATAHAKRSHRLGVLLGSSMPIILGASLVGVALAVPIAHLLGQGRHDVITFVEIGLYLLPVAVFTQSLYGVVVGEERWGVVILSRLLSTGIAAVGIVVLSLVGELTVANAAIAYLVSALASGLPFLVGLRGSRPWRFERAVASEGLAFGVRSWLSTIASNGNARLDQLMMAALVDSTQLGLYALAVTLATASGGLIAAVANALLPRVAAGEAMLAARACRITMVLVAALGAAIAIVSPFAVPLVFGSDFRGTVPMLVVLLGASVFFVPGQVLGSAVLAAGDPGATARSQVVGLVITVPALIVLLPSTGGMGAAVISLVSYAVSFAIILAAATRNFGLPWRTFVLPTRADLAWLRERLRRRRGDAPSPAAG
jgi:O-antigen/teichoic acid export membrane protein